MFKKTDTGAITTIDFKKLASDVDGGVVSIDELFDLNCVKKVLSADDLTNIFFKITEHNDRYGCAVGADENGYMCSRPTFVKGSRKEDNVSNL